MFYGPSEVVTVIEMPYKTPSGKDVVKVVLDRKVQPYEIVPKATFEAMASLEPIDDTTFQGKRYAIVLKQFSEILLENGIIYSDVPYVCKTLHNNLSACYERATNLLWTGNDEEYISGVHELSNRSLLEAEAIMKKFQKNDTDTQPTTEEAGA